MRRTQRFLLIAFALSLLVHAMVALILHPPRADFQSQREVISVVRRSTVMVARRPPPPPRPHETPHPRNVSVPRKSAARGEQAVASNGASAARQPATPSPSPAPSAVASVAACAGRSVGPALVATPPPPEIAPETRASATDGTAVIRVQLDATAAILDTSVQQSTGNSSLDLVAVGMARDAHYSPALHDCKAVAGEYAFSVKFVAW
jgi:outer membrane biosynthesis protein TonB